MNRCDVVPVPGGGTAFVCSRGARSACRGLGQEAQIEGVVTDLGPEHGQTVYRCSDCGRRVETYETADGRHIALRHEGDRR